MTDSDLFWLLAAIGFGLVAVLRLISRTVEGFLMAAAACLLTIGFLVS